MAKKRITRDMVNKAIREFMRKGGKIDRIESEEETPTLQHANYTAMSRGVQHSVMDQAVISSTHAKYLDNRSGRRPSKPTSMAIDF